MGAIPCKVVFRATGCPVWLDSKAFHALAVLAKGIPASALPLASRSLAGPESSALSFSMFTKEQFFILGVGQFLNGVMN